MKVNTQKKLHHIFKTFYQNKAICLNFMYNCNYKMKLLLKTFLTLLLLSFSVNTLLAKKVDDSRIKMLNGEYAKLSDFHSDGPLIINFWTTW